MPGLNANDTFQINADDAQVAVLLEQLCIYLEHQINVFDQNFPNATHLQRCVIVERTFHYLSLLLHQNIAQQLTANNGYSVDMLAVMELMIRELRLHKALGEEVLVNIKLDGRPFWGKNQVMVGIVPADTPTGFSIQSAKSVYPIAIANCKEDRSTRIRDDLTCLLDEELSSIQLCSLHTEMRNTEQLLGSVGLLAHQADALDELNAALKNYGPETSYGDSNRLQ
ncbi:hypothetical protein AC249_AIPGENE4419 [Exaiptasia diaphana]|nr:hypothetical protein AC249_AIPGENE4419 [Exaiptasia diaphana]